MTAILRAQTLNTKLLQTCIVACSVTLLTACGGGDDDTTAEPTPAPTASANPTQASTPTQSPTATPTPVPTAMATAAPTATPTPIPTATPAPTATPTPTDTATPTQSATPAPETFVFPFRKGEKWTVCQGYNTPSLTHKGNEINSLDLSIDASSASGSTGCNFTSLNASAGSKVVAPVDALIVWDGLTRGIGSDVVCLRLKETASNDAQSMLLGHITLDGLSARDTVTLGQEIGTVNGASEFNGGYAHIHISMYESDTCQGESIALDDVFDGDHNFSSDGSEQQWRGTELTR